MSESENPMEQALSIWEADLNRARAQYKQACTVADLKLDKARKEVTAAARRERESLIASNKALKEENAEFVDIATRKKRSKELDQLNAEKTAMLKQANRDYAEFRQQYSL